MSEEELLPLLREERARSDALEKLLVACRRYGKSMRAETEELRKDSIRLQALRAQYKEMKRTKADKARHDVLDQARQELRVGGLRDFPTLLATAVVKGRLPPGCIFARRLSDAARNVLVAPTQRRYTPEVLEHLVYGDRCRTGRACMEHLNSSNDDMSKRGEPMPSRKTVQRYIKQRAGAPGSGVRMGFLPFGAEQFAAHLCTVETMQRSLEVDSDGDEPMPEPAEVASSGLPVVPYRVACDAESIEPELHVSRRTGRYTGDEDLADVGFGVDPKELAAERRGWVTPLERVALCKLKPDEAGLALARGLQLVGLKALPAHVATGARLEQLRDRKSATYRQRLEKGRGDKRQKPKAPKKPRVKKPRKRKEPEAEAAISPDDASGPAAGLTVDSRLAAGLLVGRIILQLFPDDPADPTCAFRGRVVTLLPVARTGEYAGQLWVHVAYEDGDTEDRHVDELLENAHLVPYAEMTAGELRDAAPAALLAELSARGMTVPDAQHSDAPALANQLIAVFRPPQKAAAVPAVDLDAEEAQLLGGDVGCEEGGAADEDDEADAEVEEGEGEEGGGVREEGDDDATEEGGGAGEQGGGDEGGGAGEQGGGDVTAPDENEVVDTDSWAERQTKYNAKQVAELGQLQAAAGTAEAKRQRCQALLDRLAFRPDEPLEELAARLGKLPCEQWQALALELQQEVEEYAMTKRVEATKLIVWRARDLLHKRSVTVARWWFHGSLTSKKIDAMRNYLLPRLQAALRVTVCGKVVPRLLFLVADKEACNEVLALKTRRDGVPPTPRELAKEVEVTIREAQREKPPVSKLACEQHWRDLSPQQRADVKLIGFTEKTWVEDDWAQIADDWHELPLAQKHAARRLGFDCMSWWGGAAALAHAAEEHANGKELEKRRQALKFFYLRAPSVLPPMIFDVLCMSLHSLHPSWVAPWRKQPPAASFAVRTCVERAIEKVKARRMRESDEGAEEEELAGDQRWFEGRVQRMGLDEATRRWRTRLPPGMRKLATYLNALRPERPMHALERSFPLLPAATAGGLPTLGGLPLDWSATYSSSQLPHVQKIGAVSTRMLVAKGPGGDVRVRIELGTRAIKARAGFVTASQLVLERRIELAVASPNVSAAVLWDVAADAEMHARRIEIAASVGVRYERGWYHPIDHTASIFDTYGHFSCQSHDMKTSGHLVAGMGGKKKEEVIITHAHLLHAAETLAATDRQHVPLVVALKKTCDMHSQAIFGNLFSTRPLMDLLRQRGQWREWAIMSVLHLRWRAWDQRGISPAERVRCIEVLSPLLDANLIGGAMWRPSIGGEQRAAAGLLAGVRSGFFQGFSWQTVSARLAGASMHACVRREAPRYALTWNQRSSAQNDVEGYFGDTSDGSSSKKTIMMMGPRLDMADVLDAIRHCPARALSSVVKLSLKKAYDAVEGTGTKREAQLWMCGDGNARTSVRAIMWEYGQRKRAIATAAGKQQTVRMDNTLASRAVRAGARESKRGRVG